MMGPKLAESHARFRLLARRAVLTRAGQDRSEDPEVELNRIEAALRRIDDGRYGICDACGATIGSQMLIADPARPLCSSCASPRGHPA